jgi:hypothetical protein
MTYLEVSRAPYSAIKQISVSVPIKTVRGMHRNPRHLEWHPLASLSLDQPESIEEHHCVSPHFELKHQHACGMNLAAWKTAYIEIRDKAGIGRVDPAYLTDKVRSDEKRLEASHQGTICTWS